MATKNYTFIDGDFINFDSFGELVLDNDGSFTQEFQSIVFEENDNEIAVNYSLYVEGDIKYERDYEYQGGKCPVIGGLNISINEVYINDEKVNVDSDVLYELENEIKKYVKN